MTIEAVKRFVSKAVVDDEFRNRFTTGKMTFQEIAAAVADLDVQDVNAIVLALMSAGDFPHFRAGIDLYINRRYGSGPAGDDLPISV